MTTNATRQADSSDRQPKMADQQDIQVNSVAVSGASGFVGSALSNSLAGQGIRVTALTRHPSGNEAEIGWDPYERPDLSALDGVDAVVHLAGESIAGRWTEKRKRAIRESRVKGTRNLCAALAALDHRPRTLVCASAIGVYGAREDEIVTEDGAVGDDFLAGVCRDWESATAAACDAGIRVVNLRIGIVLGRSGGALKNMLTPFRLGLGGKVGSGRQYMSWIARDDLVRVIEHCLHDASLSGPVNAVAPEPVTNSTFTKTLGRVLRRPTVVPMPAFAVRLLFGEMGDALLLHGARVVPTRLETAGFRFGFPQLEGALRHELGQGG